MYLKRLEIQGFKSFANKVVLDFLPPQSGRFSITAVVGPNGSGKSNVVDAIRWVMGEQSIKNLRGKKSEDVIFSGSENKGALGACEVTMILDNADNRAEVDYPEIVITRRLYRSGEGEYLINNNPVRLLDIHLLLAKAQFGQHSHSIISQGTIDKLLTVNQAERKEFLDEASGIKEFQIKQHQAALKLNRTRENMEQAERLLAEVEPRLKILARQVKKLEKRQEVELSLREAQEKYYTTLHKRNQDEINEINRQLEGVETNYRSAFNELSVAQTELAELARAESRQEIFSGLQTKHQLASKEKNDIERDLAILEGRLTSGYREAGKGNIGWLENKIKEIKFTREQLTSQIQLATAELVRYQEQFNLLQKKINDLSVEKTEKSVQLSRLRSALMQNQSEQNFFQFSGLSAVKALLEARENWGGKIFGLVAELGEVEETYRVALDVAAGANLSSLVVENDETGKRAIEYLRTHKLGVATFLPLNKIQPRILYSEVESILQESDVLGLALDLIKYPTKFANIFAYIFGDTIVVKDLAAAQRVGIGRARMVTLEGDVVEKRGVLRGGYRKTQGLSFASELMLSGIERARDFEAQINSEEQNLITIGNQLDTAKTELAKLEMEVKMGENKINLQNTEEQNLSRELAGLEKELQLSQISPSEYSKVLADLNKDKEALIKSLTVAEEKLIKIDAEIAEFNQKEEDKKQRVFALQEKMQFKQNEVNNILTIRNELKISLAKIETKQEDLREEAQNDMGTALESVLERNPVVAPIEELNNLAQEIQKLKYQLSLIGGIDEEVTAEFTTTKERYDFLEGQLVDLRSATTDLEKMVLELDELMKKKRAVAFKKIQKEFERYFKILFSGGSAKLEEIYGEPEPEDELLETVQDNTAMQQYNNTTIVGEEENTEKQKHIRTEKILTGIDIIANPPGKKIKNINALSGGERTLTSIALICAILNCNPSPFVILDEVEAALDEANTLRFANIMGELSTKSQFVVITHNRVTMHSADALYGVTMSGDGVSKLLSVKLNEAEKMDK